MMLCCPRAVALALALAAHAACAAYTAQLLYQFPSHAQWVENMAVRPNGHLLLTTFDRARVYELAPSRSSQQPPRLVAALPAADAALGIAEIRPDVFAVATGRLNRTSFHLDGSARIDTLDFTCRGCATQPAIATAAMLPQALLPNGLAALPPGEDRNPSFMVLCADSATGTIYRADTATGAVHVALHDPALAPAPTADDDPFLALLGVNGVQAPGDGFVYVTSTSARLLGRYALDNAAALEVLARYAAPRSPDDFAVARNGTVFGAVPLDSVSVVAVLPGKKGLRDVRFLVDHDERMQRPTSVVLSRDETTLYVSTGGRNVPGGKGGQVFAVRLT